jgi:hypothetical protein
VPSTPSDRTAARKRKRLTVGAVGAAVVAVIAFVSGNASGVIDIIDFGEKKFGAEARFRSSLNGDCRKYAGEMTVQSYGSDDDLKDRVQKRLAVHSDFLAELEDRSPPDALYGAFEDYRNAATILQAWAGRRERRIPEGVKMSQRALNQYLLPSRRATPVIQSGTKAATRLKADICAAQSLLWPL